MSYEQRAETEFFYASRLPCLSPRVFLRHPLKAIKWSRAIRTVNRSARVIDRWLEKAGVDAAVLEQFESEDES